MFIITQAAELIITALSILNIPCKNHSNSVNRMSKTPRKEICFTFLDLCILYNCGKCCTEVTIGANTATILANIL